ncbi:MAG: AMP-binding protein, partial [Actinomycetota bacterium]
MLARENLLPNAVARWARATPDTVAIQYADGEQRTYAELHDVGLRWAAALIALGVGRGVHVATMLAGDFAPHSAMLAIGWTGAVEVPLNTAYRGQTLRHALALADVSVIVC